MYLFNRIISWLAGYKTGPVYMKSKSGSISQRTWSKSRPAHVLDGLAPRAHGQLSITCTVNFKLLERSCETQSGNEASQFFFMLVLALLVR